MQFRIDHSPDFALLTFDLTPGDAVVAEAGAMAAMSPGIKMQTTARGGIMASLKRAVLGGESFFVNTYTAEAQARIHFAPAAPGDVIHYPLSNGALMMQSSAFVVADPTVQLDTKWEGAKGFFSGTGLFLLKAHGSGNLFFNCYGAARVVDVQGSYVVDTGHIVAFEPSLQYQVRSSGGLKSLFFSGEGLIAEFRGNGKVWVQTRNPSSLAAFLQPYRKVQKSNS